MMKKVFSFVLLLAIVVQLLVVPGFAADPLTLSVSEQTAHPGDTVQVTVSVANNTGLASLKFNVAYDSALTLTNVEFNAAFGSMITAPTPYTNPEPLTMISPLSDVTADGVFATLTFTVAANAQAGKKNISLTYDAEDIYDGNYDPVSTIVVNGGITVVDDHISDNDQDPTEPFAQLKNDVTFASETGAIRFVAALNSLKYQKAGFVLSLSNSEPTVGGNASTAYETNTVYPSVFAGEETVSAAELGGEYVYALTLNNIPNAHFGTTIYVRAFVLTEQGEYQYSVVKSYSVYQLLGGLIPGGDSSNGGEVDFGGIR